MILIFEGEVGLFYVICFQSLIQSQSFLRHAAAEETIEPSLKPLPTYQKKLANT